MVCGLRVVTYSNSDQWAGYGKFSVGVKFDKDYDQDKINDKGDLVSIVTVKGFESVTVPAGTFPNCAKVERQTTVTVTASSNGTRLSEQGTETIWLASGIGQVKYVSQIADQTVTEELTSFTPN